MSGIGKQIQGHAWPKLNAEFNPGNARWCEKHGKLECAKGRRRGPDPCHNPAIRGMDACRYHGGAKGSVMAVKGESTIQIALVQRGEHISAWSPMGTPAPDLNIGAEQAVMAMLQQAWIRAAVYGALLKKQVEKDTSAVFGPATDVEEIFDVSGLIGFRHGAAGSHGTIYQVSEEARALVSLESAERDRVVKFAKTAHDMGISDRLTATAERWSEIVVTRVLALTDALQLTPTQQMRLPELVQLHLGSIELGGM